MQATIIDGFSIAQQHRAIIANEVTAVQQKGLYPCLAVILVGDNPASHSYVKAKKNALLEANIQDKTHYLAHNTQEKDLINLIHHLNNDTSVHGILVQLPLPSHINEQNIIKSISPQKDVDCFHPFNIGNFFLGTSILAPCTPKGIVHLLKQLPITLAGKHAVIVGRSNIVGKPLALLLSQHGIDLTVTICHSKTKELANYTKQADILVAAIGSAGFISQDMVKEHACVIDVGVNRITDTSKKNGFRLAGDVDFAQVQKKADYITPVPRGVGPMTIAMLLENTILLAKQSYNDNQLLQSTDCISTP